MQTFLPFANFQRSVEVLDYRRLGKQRVETSQILDILCERKETRGWANHPATKMWMGYAEALKVYQNCTIEEWVRRGYKNNMSLEIIDWTKVQMPRWFGGYDFHRSHRSNLLRKDFEYYSQYFSEPIDLPYIWNERELIGEKN